MKTVCWTTVILALAMWVPATSTEDKRSDSVRSQPKSMLEYELLRSPEQTYRRTTIRLYVKPLREDALVTARFHVCKGGEDLGRFPLQRLDKEKGRGLSIKDDGRILFMAECLAEEFVNESFVQLTVKDERSGKPLPGVRIHLKDAAIWKGP